MKRSAPAGAGGVVAAATEGGSTTRTLGAAAFWPLLWRASGYKLSLRLADVALFDPSGLPTMWLFTSRSGHVKRKSRDSLNTKSIYHAFRRSAAPSASVDTIVAIAYLEDGSQENVTNTKLEELLLRGPLIGRWKNEMRVEALRVYILPKGGHGSGFRNCFKFAGNSSPPITSTQRLLALGHTVSSNVKATPQNQKSRMTKMNEQLDQLTARIVSFLRSSSDVNGTVLFLEVDYCIDAADKIWLVHALQFSASTSSNSAKLKRRASSTLISPTMTKEDDVKKETRDMLRNVPSGHAKSLPSLSHWSLKSGVATSPSMSKRSRHRDSHEFICPGVFCGFSQPNDEGDKKRARDMWTTDKAMRRERDALQETLKSYRRTMAKTAALTRSMQRRKNHNGNPTNAVDCEGAENAGDITRATTTMNGAGDVSVTSLLQVYEKGHSDSMSPALLNWCQQQEKAHESVCAALQISEPTVGQTLVMCEPIFIRWSNSTPSRLRVPVSHVDLHLYCGNARVAVVCHRLPNEGHATWRVPAAVRRKEKETLYETGNAAVWRILVVCSERPHVYAFSDRFRLLRSSSDATGAYKGQVKVRDGESKTELELQMEEEELYQIKAGKAGDVSLFWSFGPGVLAGAHPSTYVYRETKVCENCFSVYDSMDRNRERSGRKNGLRRGEGRFAKQLERTRNRENLKIARAAKRVIQRKMRIGIHAPLPTRSAATSALAIANMNKESDVDETSRKDKNTKEHSPAEKHRKDKSPKSVQFSVFEQKSRKMNDIEESDDDEEPLLGDSSRSANDDEDNGNLSKSSAESDKKGKAPRHKMTTSTAEHRNVIANFVNRVVGFLHENFDGVVPERDGDLLPEDWSFIFTTNKALAHYLSRIQKGVDIQQGMADVVAVAQVGMEYLMDTAYWTILPNDRARCGFIVALALDLTLLIAMITDPYNPDFASDLKMQLNVKQSTHWVPNQFRAGLIPSGHRLNKLENLRLNKNHDRKQKGHQSRDHSESDNGNTDGVIKSNERRLRRRERTMQRRLEREQRLTLANDKRKKELHDRERGWGKGSSSQASQQLQFDAPKNVPASQDGPSRRSAQIAAGSNLEGSALAYRVQYPAWGAGPGAKRPDAAARMGKVMNKRVPQISRVREKQLQGPQYLLDVGYKGQDPSMRLDKVLPTPPTLPQDLGVDETRGHKDLNKSMKMSDPLVSRQRNSIDGGKNFAIDDDANSDDIDAEETNMMSLRSDPRETDVLNFGQSSLRRALWLGRNAINQSGQGHQSNSAPEQDSNRKSFGKSVTRGQKNMHGRQGAPINDDRGSSKNSLSVKKKSVGRSKASRKHSGIRKSSANAMNVSSDRHERAKTMPSELEHHMGLRQILSLLVLGQLSDIESILKISSEHGLRMLAHCRTDGDQLILGAPLQVHKGGRRGKKLPKTPPFAAKLLRDFLQVGSSFALIFKRKDETSFRVIGAGTLGEGKSSADVTNDHGGKSRMRRAYRAAESVNRLVSWMGVGKSRGEILRGVAEWLGGQAAMANHHWTRALEMAVATGGNLAYDAAVAKFLMGTHRMAGATLHQWTELVKADAHFAKLGAGSRRELDAVRAELAFRRGARPMGAPAGKDVVGKPPALPHTREFDTLSAHEPLVDGTTNHRTDPTSLRRPPIAIQETLAWGRRSLEAVKRRLHHERLLPVYHREEDASVGVTIDVLVNKRQQLAKAVVMAESQLAALEAEVSAAVSTGCVEARPNSAMGFTMERKLVKLIDEISVHARELSAIAEKQKLMRADALASNSGETHEEISGSNKKVRRQRRSRRREQAHDNKNNPPSDGNGQPGDRKKVRKGGNPSRDHRKSAANGGSAVSSESNETTSTPSEIPKGPKGAALLMMMKTTLFQGAREGLLSKVTQVVGSKLWDVTSSKDEEGNTALIIAAMNGRFDVCEYLATRGGERFVNAQNLESNTALHYAHENSDTKLIQMLLQYGANPNIRNMYGLVPERGSAPHSFADFANI